MDNQFKFDHLVISNATGAELVLPDKEKCIKINKGAV